MSRICFPGRSERVIRRLRRMVFLALLLGSLCACSRRMDKNDLRALGIEAMQSGDYDGAWQRFQEALEVSDGEVSELQIDVLRYRAECELRLERYEDAKNSYSILQKLDDDAEHDAVYQSVLDDLDGLDQLEQALTVMEAGDYETAYEMMDPLASLSGTMSGRAAWFNRAVCLEYLGRYSEAEDAFDTYLATYPDDENAQKEKSFLATR